MTEEIAYTQRLAALHQELGIPADYAGRRRLEVQPEADELVSIGRDESGRDCRLLPAAARAWRAMGARAREYDVELVALSGFRSVERQTEIIRGKLALGQKIAEVLNTMAAPGYSEHHTGRALDIGAPGDLPLEESFAETKAFSWLERYAGGFGFQMSYPRGNVHGFIYEPWHWCWRAR
jgi:D-alanyl-D-alanine carboxypeptidase